MLEVSTLVHYYGNRCGSRSCKELTSPITIPLAVVSTMNETLSGWLYNAVPRARSSDRMTQELPQRCHRQCASSKHSCSSESCDDAPTALLALLAWLFGSASVVALHVVRRVDESDRGLGKLSRELDPDATGRSELTRMTIRPTAFQAGHQSIHSSSRFRFMRAQR